MSIILDNATEIAGSQKHNKHIKLSKEPNEILR